MFQRHWNMLKRDYARYLNEEKFSLLRLAKASRRIPGLHYMLWFRLAAATQNNRFPAAHRYCCHHLKAVGYKYGFDIPWDTSIGAGFVIKHFGLLIINNRCVIGENCTINSGSVIGKSYGKVPIIGDNVTIGVNCSIIGGVTVASGAVIGAGSVVVKDVQANAVVAGNPARLLKLQEVGE